jgi:hypothetical protein
MLCYTQNCAVGPDISLDILHHVEKCYKLHFYILSLLLPIFLLYPSFVFQRVKNLLDRKSLRFEEWILFSSGKQGRHAYLVGFGIRRYSWSPDDNVKFNIVAKDIQNRIKYLGLLKYFMWAYDFLVHRVINSGLNFIQSSPFTLIRKKFEFPTYSWPHLTSR